jgi:hypothetical protein
MEVKFSICHPESITRAYLSFQMINQFQQPIVHAFDPDLNFGARSGSSLLVCRFANIRLNVGRYCLRTFLSGPPGGDIYETLDPICHFEVMRSDRNIPWGWRPDACAYHEQYTWSAASVRSEVEP